MIFFRNDDISPSTNQNNLLNCYSIIRNLYPESKIISGITLFSKFNDIGSVYSGFPFKNMPVNWFYDVDRFLMESDYIIKEDIASHGLFHVNHAKISKDAQAMSILSSCNFLKTKQFIPPFNSINKDTIDICRDNNVNILSLEHDWKNFEYEKFDSKHKYWSFHSWKFTPSKLYEVLSASVFDKRNS